MTTRFTGPPTILVAGVGNIFLGDDAFGVEVVQRLVQRDLPPEVRVADFGIRGLDLVYALLDGYEHVILVDAAPRGGTPGSLYVIEPELSALAPGEEGCAVEGHNMDPVRVLQMVSTFGGHVKHLIVVGCEPERTNMEDETALEMSAPVRAAVDEAVALIESLISEVGVRVQGSGVVNPANSP